VSIFVVSFKNNQKKMTNLFILLSFLIISLTVTSQNVAWTFQTDGSIHSSPVAIDGTLYIGSGDWNLYAIAQSTGKKIWSYESDGAIYSDVGYQDDAVFFGNDKGNLYSLNRHSGEFNWKFTSEGEKKLDLWDYYLSSPVASNGLVYWGSGDGHVYALNTGNGELVWKFDTGSIVHASPVIADGKVLIGNYSGDFYALDIQTGEEIWKFKAIGSRYFPNAEFQKAALVEDGIVYIGSRDLNLYALDLKTGRGIWNMPEKGGSWIIATPLIHGENIYFGSSDTYKFYSLNKNNGRENWNIPIHTRSYGSPVAYKDLIIFPGFDGKLRGVNPQNGKFEWMFQSETSKTNYDEVYDLDNNFKKDIGIHNYTQESERLLLSLGGFINSPLLLGDTLYVGSTDGKLYAIQINE